MRLWLGGSRAMQVYMLALVAGATLAALLFAFELASAGAAALALVLAGLPGFIYLVARRVIIAFMRMRDEIRSGLAAQAQLARDVGDIERYVAAAESVVVGAVGEAVSSAGADVEDSIARSVVDMGARLEGISASLGAIIAVERDLSQAVANESRAVADELTRVSGALGRMHDAIADVKGEDRKLFNALQSKLQGLRVNIEQLAQSAGEYNSLRDRLITGDDEPPMLGGWALTVPTMNAIARRILTESKPLSVMELGSGASTVWIAMALRERGAGHCTTFEHLPQYAARVRSDLERRGLSEWVTVVDAPLVETSVGGHSYNWYDQERFVELRGIDLLLVDGPPAEGANMARYPAVPVLAELLNEGAWVVLDDTIRVDEKRIADLWQEQNFSGVRLSTPRSTGKSLVFEVCRNETLQ